MLVLERRKNERIWVGEQVRLTVLEIGNGRVKIGFEGPKEIKIVREELFNELPALGEKKCEG